MNEVILHFDNASYAELEVLRVRLGFPTRDEVIAHLIEVGYEVIKETETDETIPPLPVNETQAAINQSVQAERLGQAIANSGSVTVSGNTARTTVTDANGQEYWYWDFEEQARRTFDNTRV